MLKRSLIAFYTSLQEGQCTKADSCDTEQVSGPLSSATGRCGGGSGAAAAAAGGGGGRSCGGCDQDGLEDGRGSDSGDNGFPVLGVGGDGVVSGSSGGEGGAGDHDLVVQDAADWSNGRVGARLGLGCERDKLLESVSSSRRVDSANHASLAMVAFCLTAVKPDWRRVIHCDGE